MQDPLMFGISPFLTGVSLPHIDVDNDPSSTVAAET